MKRIIGYTIMATLFIGCLLIAGARDQYDINVGKKIVLDKDTLKIVNYMVLARIYILSDGTGMNKDRVDTLLTKTNKL